MFGLLKVGGWLHDSILATSCEERSRVVIFMKIKVCHHYPCGMQRVFYQYNWRGFGYSPNSHSGKCPNHGYNCKSKDVN